MNKILHTAIAIIPLAAGWVTGTLVKAYVLIQAAFIEGYEAGRKL